MHLKTTCAHARVYVCASWHVMLKFNVLIWIGTELSGAKIAWACSVIPQEKSDFDLPIDNVVYYIRSIIIFKF